MKSDFNDIFESIKQLHKKYNSEEYLQNISHFNESSKELEEILEKYKKDETQSLSKSKKNKRTDKKV